MHANPTEASILKELALLADNLNPCVSPQGAVAPLLIAGEILTELARRKIPFRIFQHSLKGLNRTYHSFRADLSIKGKTVRGFSTNSDRSGQAKSVIEAFERLTAEDLWSRSDLGDLPQLNPNSFKCLRTSSIPSLDDDQEMQFSEIEQPSPGTHLLSYHFKSQQVVALDKSLVSGEGELYPRNSCGWAAHGNPKDAAINAALEAYERHVFLAAWANETPPRIIVDLDSELHADLTSECTKRSCVLALHEFQPTNEIHVVVASIRKKNAPQQILIGLAASTSREEACDKALEELLTVWIHQVVIREEQKTNIEFAWPQSQGAAALEQFLGLENPPAGLFEPQSPKHEVISRFLSDRDFFFVNGLYGTSTAHSKISVIRAYSPKMIPLFRDSAPKLMPKKFRLAFEQSQKACPI